MHCINLQFIIFLYSVCDCTNYYFSSSSGSNSNKGTQIDSPWKSFSKLENVSIKAADNILLKSNDLFNEQLFLQNIHGTELNPVTITTYNTTNTLYYHRAIINLQNDINNTTNSTIICLNCEGIIISDLELSHSQFGIAIVYDNLLPRNVYNISIKNNFFHNINGYGLPNTSSWWGAAIVTGQNTYNNGATIIYNLNIMNNLCNESDTFFRWNYYAKYPAQIASCVMNGNALTYNYYNIVPLGNWMKSYNVTNNIFLNNGPIEYFHKGTTDIIIVTTYNVSNIINNEFGNRGEWNTSADGCSIDFETHAVGSKVIGNYIHDSYGAAIMVFGHPDTNQLNANLTINNNIFIRDGCIQTRDDHGTIAFMWPASGFIENNFFVKCINQSVPIYWDRNNDTFLDNWIFMNNTIQNYTDGYVVDDPIVNVDNNNQLVQVSAKCGSKSPQCVLRYTIDGSKPNLNSIKYEQNQILKFYITTPVLFKAFQNGLIESATVGQIVNPL
eukprot:365345_1